MVAKRVLCQWTLVTKLLSDTGSHISQHTHYHIDSSVKPESGVNAQRSENAWLLRYDLSYQLNTGTC